MSQGANPTTTYQLTTLTPGLAERLLQDASPTTVLNEFWQLLTTELMTANLTQVDFDNILDMVEKAFANMLTGIPEDLWPEFRIKETVWDKDSNTGELKAITTKEYTIVEFWDQIYTKVYIKCCNSRDGHLIKALTEQRIKQLYEERGGIMKPMPGTAMPMAVQDKDGGWRP
jgi:hypothetical protein